MGWKQEVIAAATMILLHAAHATAQTYVPNKYPAPRCGQPHFEVLPQAEDAKPPDQAKASLYDYEARQYNREVEAYGVCMRKYIAKANRDAQRIRTEANKDVQRITDNANASIAMIRAQIRKATASAKKLSNIPPGTLTGK
jgi:hypothetical protein